MKSHRVVAIMAFVLALIGGALVAIAALSSMGRLSLTSFILNGLELLFALGGIFGGWLIYTGLRRTGGGFMALLAGIVLIVLTGGFAMNVVLIILAGVLGLVAAEMKPWWAFWK